MVENQPLLLTQQFELVALKGMSQFNLFLSHNPYERGLRDWIIVVQILE